MKRQEQASFEEFAKQAGDLTTDAENVLDFAVDEIADEERREAWEQFIDEWNDHVDGLLNALQALKEGGDYIPEGAAKWLA